MFAKVLSNLQKELLLDNPWEIPVKDNPQRSILLEPKEQSKDTKLLKLSVPEKIALLVFLSNVLILVLC